MTKRTCRSALRPHNLNNQPVQTIKDHSRSSNCRTVRWMIRRPEEETKYQGCSLPKGSFVSGEKLSSKIFPATVRRYRIKMNALDSKGRDVNGQQDLLLGKTTNVLLYLGNMGAERTRPSPQYGEDADFLEPLMTTPIYYTNCSSSTKSGNWSNWTMKTDVSSSHLRKEYGDGIVALFTFMKRGIL